MNCPAEPLVLKPEDKIPTEIDPITGMIREYVVVVDQNDYERWNEAVRRSGAACRNIVKANCSFYKDLKIKVICKGLPKED